MSTSRLVVSVSKHYKNSTKLVGLVKRDSSSSSHRNVVNNNENFLIWR